MKKSLLTGTNAVITFLMALLGFGTSGCIGLYGIPEIPGPAEYGTPYATFEAAGKVTDEAAQPVEKYSRKDEDKMGKRVFPGSIYQ